MLINLWLWLIPESVCLCVRGHSATYWAGDFEKMTLPLRIFICKIEFLIAFAFWDCCGIK